MSPDLAALTLSGILVHLFVDWFLQNDWMAQNKMKWSGSRPHGSGLVHAATHATGMMLVFPWWAALLVGVTHWLIDLRFPLIWWRRTFRMTTDPTNPAAMHVAIWQDQVAHFLVVFGVAVLIGAV